MSIQEEEEVPSLTFTSLETASTVDILSAPLRDPRKVLQDGPSTHRNQAELSSRNEVLAAVLELQKVLREDKHEGAEDKANSEKLFALPPSEVIRLSRCARPLLIRMMQSALRFDPTLQPRTFEPSDQGSVASVVLSWHVVATQRALQTAVSSNPAPQNNAADPTLLQDSSNADQERTVEQEQVPQATPIVEPNENLEGMLPSDNPFATNNSKARELSPVDLSELIPRKSPPKRRLPTVVSKGGYLATVSGRTTCAPCKAGWSSMASVLTSVAHQLSSTVPCHDGLPTCGQALARLWTTTVWLGKSRFNF